MGKAEISWEAASAFLIAAVSGIALTWGTILSTQADVAALKTITELIREDTQYLRDRIDSLGDRP